MLGGGLVGFCGLWIDWLGLLGYCDLVDGARWGWLGVVVV